MEWFLIALGAVIVGGFVLRRGLRARERRRRTRQELAGVRTLLSEDLAYVAEQLGRLDREIVGVMLDEVTRGDVEQAHASYASAQRGSARLHSSADAGVVATALGEAGYRAACGRARVAGEEPPQRGVPCFFDPRHGVSVDDVMWTEPVHGTRTVPVCARDAALVGAGGSPHTRTVQVGARTLVYWDAGEPAGAYYRGWFSTAIPFLPAAPPRRRWRVDLQAVKLAEAEATKYSSPTSSFSHNGPAIGGGGS